ncbi:unnamed protein product [Phyllotreta striolata]|uniref:Uncharacterized protein n=1 Tax=Phyllotreta striolata TaxID=444603 RepID=A0A9N9TMQ1_PHYSR|nr:unnamed protein product [Phyllotreta striolata]
MDVVNKEKQRREQLFHCSLNYAIKTNPVYVRHSKRMMQDNTKDFEKILQKEELLNKCIEENHCHSNLDITINSVENLPAEGGENGMEENGSVKMESPITRKNIERSMPRLNDFKELGIVEKRKTQFISKINHLFGRNMGEYHLVTADYNKHCDNNLNGSQTERKPFVIKRKIATSIKELKNLFENKQDEKNTPVGKFTDYNNYACSTKSVVYLHVKEQEEQNEILSDSTSTSSIDNDKLDFTSSPKINGEEEFDNNISNYNQVTSMTTNKIEIAMKSIEVGNEDNVVKDEDSNVAQENHNQLIFQTLGEIETIIELDESDPETDIIRDNDENSNESEISIEINENEMENKCSITIDENEEQYESTENTECESEGEDVPKIIISLIKGSYAEKINLSTVDDKESNEINEKEEKEEETKEEEINEINSVNNETYDNIINENDQMNNITKKTNEINEIDEINNVNNETDDNEINKINKINEMNEIETSTKTIQTCEKFTQTVDYVAHENKKDQIANPRSEDSPQHIHEEKNETDEEEFEQSTEHIQFQEEIQFKINIDTLNQRVNDDKINFDEINSPNNNTSTQPVVLIFKTIQQSPTENKLNQRVDKRMEFSTHRFKVESVDSNDETTLSKYKSCKNLTIYNNNGKVKTLSSSLKRFKSETELYDSGDIFTMPKVLPQKKDNTLISRIYKQLNASNLILAPKLEATIKDTFTAEILAEEEHKSKRNKKENYCVNLPDQRNNMLNRKYPLDKFQRSRDIEALAKKKIVQGALSKAQFQERQI